MADNLLEIQSSQIAPKVSPSQRQLDVAESIANIEIVNHLHDDILNHISKPLDVKTPPEKVKKRPDGFDYVEGSFMDFETKKFMPLYEYTFLHISFNMGWINVVVSLKDRTTGNIELGSGAARIQVPKGVDEPGFRDVIDMNNNIKAALTNAIKNAQSRFGICADIYGRRESIPSNLERERFDSLKIEIKAISTTRALQFEEGWNSLGTDWTEYMDKWQSWIDRQQKKKD